MTCKNKYTFSFFLNCVVFPEKNRKNALFFSSTIVYNPLKFSIGISALGLRAHIFPTCRSFRPCNYLNTSNWPLKLWAYSWIYLRLIYGKFFFFDFLDPIKQASALIAIARIIRFLIHAKITKWRIFCGTKNFEKIYFSEKRPPFCYFLTLLFTLLLLHTLLRQYVTGGGGSEKVKSVVTSLIDSWYLVFNIHNFV